MKARRLAAGAVALMLAGLAPACGGDDSSSDTTSAASSDTTSAASSDTTSAASSDTTSASSMTEDTAGETPAKTSEIDPSREIRQINTSPPPPSWDPATTTAGITQIVRFYNSVYDTLVHIDENNELQPQLATKWTYDSTNTVLTLTLRSDVTFSDGAKFDASAAKLNLERVQQGTAQTARLLTDIKSIEVKSPTELVITQNAPSAAVLFALGTPAASMVSPLVLQNDVASLAQNPVGSGPYTLESMNPTTAVFVRNDSYWDKSVTVPARQTIISAVDPNARINALLSGTVDFAQLSQLPPTPDLLAKVDAGEFQLLTVSGTPSVLGMNTSLPPFDNPKVVQAINYALDRDQINEVVYNGMCKPASQLFVPGQPGYVDGLEYEFDLEKARQLMDESGVGEVTIKFQGVAGAPTAPTELYAAMLAEIGITLDIVNSPPPDVARNFYSGQFPMSVLQLFLSAPDPIFVTDYLTGPFNPGTKDPELVALVDKANALAIDDPGRDQAYQDVNRYVFDHPMAAPLCQSPNTLVATTDVVGMDTIPMAEIGNMDTSRMGLRAES